MTTGLLSKVKRKNYLFVEGPDDKNVFIHLLNNHGITTPDPDQRGYFKDRNEPFDIKNCGGIHELLKAFRVELKGDTDNNRYGIVVEMPCRKLCNGNGATNHFAGFLLFLGLA